MQQRDQSKHRLPCSSKCGRSLQDEACFQLPTFALRTEQSFGTLTLSVREANVGVISLKLSTPKKRSDWANISDSANTPVRQRFGL